MPSLKACWGGLVRESRDTFGCACGPSDDEAYDKDDEEGNSLDENGRPSSVYTQVHMLRRDLNEKYNFPDNSIRTSKYTRLSAVPVSLLNQFRKISNVYFLLVMIVNLIPGASPINPVSSIIPLCVVLGAGILKDIWEDVKRQRADSKANASQVYVLRNGNKFVPIRNRDVYPGDLMILRLGEEVKADCLVISTSLPDGVTYIETANLDGETNAKTRRAKIETVERLGTVEDIVANASVSSDVYGEPYGATTSETYSREAHGRACSGCPCGSGTHTRKERGASVLLTEEVSESVNKKLAGEYPVEENEEMKVRNVSEGGCGLQVPTPTQSGDYSYPASGAAPHHLGLPTKPQHHRHRTFDERLERDGLLLPPEMLDMSRHYEAIHSRTQSRTTVAQLRGEGDHDDHTDDEGALAGSGGGGNGESSSDKVSGVVILAGLPNADLSSWYGLLRFSDGVQVPFGVDQFLPRGCLIRNTEWVLAVVVYTGRNTKMLLNLRSKSLKTTVMGRRLNILNLILFIFTQVMIFLLCGLSLWFKHRHLRRVPGSVSKHAAWYMQWSLDHLTDAKLFWWRYLTNFAILSYLIPMSLYVTLEFNKAMQVMLIGSDKRMAVFDEFSGKLKKSRPKTSELNCQLGQVRYIFTDKTGTLTENLMTYVGGFAAGHTQNERTHPGGLGCQLLKRMMEMCTTNLGREDLSSSKATLSISTQPWLTSGQSGGAFESSPVLSNSGAHSAQSHSLGGGASSPTDNSGHVMTFGSVRVLEETLEEDPVFQYLRALALCHSVVCFDKHDSVPGQPKENSSNTGAVSTERSQSFRHETSGAESQSPSHSRKRRKRRHNYVSVNVGDSDPARTDVKDGDGGSGHHEQRGARFFVPNAVPSSPGIRRSRRSSLHDSTAPLSQQQGADRSSPAFNPDEPLTSVHNHSTSGGTPTDLRSGIPATPSRPNPRIPAAQPWLMSVSDLTQTLRQQYHGTTLSDAEILHGRTGSLGWYYDRYSTNALQQRPLNGRWGQPTLAAILSQYISRDKVYEGQSLDETALVTAARENGFELFQRTAKQIYVKLMGTLMCYDVIAELEFTSQRKLMSILLQRNHSSDSEDVARTATAAKSSYYRDYTLYEETERELGRSGTTAQSGAEGAATAAGIDGADNAEEDSLQARISPTILPQQERSSNEPFEVDESHGVGVLNRSQTQLYADAPDARRVGGEVADAARSRPVSSQVSMNSQTGKREQRGGPSMSSSAGDGKYLLLVKGADSSMMDIVNTRNPENVRMKPVLMEHMNDMAKHGLRTLVVGQRYVPEEEVLRWLPINNAAQCSMDDRSAHVHAACALIERDVDLIGITAVEDKLQDGVPETLDFLSKASIVVWMLTGDKRETAVTIAHSSGLVSHEFDDGCLCHLDVTELLSAEASLRIEIAERQQQKKQREQEQQCVTPESSAGLGSDDIEARRSALQQCREQLAQLADEQLTAAETRCDEKATQYGTSAVVLVIDGKTLDFLLADRVRSSRFFTLGTKSCSAVCCRMTPLQKAEIVRMFQHNVHAVALAIGDGANDVSMIQESKIGVGIMGLEGSQAELASDFAIPKFRFLKRLLMVHGRFSIYREAHCILYSLYKNVIITVGLVVYSFYSGFSGMSFIDSWLLAIFSIFCCSLQPLLIGIFDKDVEDELAESLPQLYPPLSRENMYFSVPYIIKWFWDGIVEGALFFFVILYTAAKKDDLFSYRSGGVEDYGETFFTMLVIVADLRAGQTVSYCMIILVLAVLAEILALPVIQIVYSEMHNLAGSNWCVYTARSLYGTGKFWMFLLLSVGVFIVCTVASNLYIQMFAPWSNACFAMTSAHESSYRQLYVDERDRLKTEYMDLVKQQQSPSPDGAEEHGASSPRPNESRGVSESNEGAIPHMQQ